MNDIVFAAFITALFGAVGATLSALAVKFLRRKPRHDLMEEIEKLWQRIDALEKDAETLRTALDECQAGHATCLRRLDELTALVDSFTRPHFERGMT